MDTTRKHALEHAKLCLGKWLLYEAFKVKQGIRQGGTISTWIYNLFLDGLLNELERSRLGTTIHNVPTGNTTLADDIALAAISPQNLQEMINMTCAYANKFRYSLNAAKSFTLTFGAKRNDQLSHNICLNNEPISMVTHTKHVGIILNTNLTDHDKVQNACKKAKVASLSVMSLDTLNHKVNPLRSPALVAKIYIPSLLFGAELWSNLSRSDIS